MNPDPANWAGQARHISTSSAMNPALLLCAICVPTGATMTVFGTDFVRLVGIVWSGLPLMMALWQLGYFTHSDRDRLQNERHVEQKMIIQGRIGMRSAGGIREFDAPPALPPVENPAVAGGGLDA